ncbi:uncharacterized protein LOC135145994 isoform X2 [Zophobas morio]|uniref:uncharacterized protein LOC135145994 isoform X2 n=1 Tax=Zophobas morio TaxID=2755281 RepID=UPI003083471B
MVAPNILTTESQTQLSKVSISETVIGQGGSEIYVKWIKTRLFDTVIAALPHGSPLSNSLWISKDKGKTFINYNENIENTNFHIEPPMIINPHFPNIVILLSSDFENFIVTRDGGATWNIHYFPADLKVNGAKWYFHPTNEDYILLLTGFDPYKSLHLTTDFGANWNLNVAYNVNEAKWGSYNFHTEKTVFFSLDNNFKEHTYDLYYTDDLFATRTLLRQRISEFSLLKNILFVTVPVENSLQLHVCTNSNTSGTLHWNRAHFPLDVSEVHNKTGIEFAYDILEESYGSVFISVVNGRINITDKIALTSGNLYKSNADATQYTLSLPNLLFTFSSKSDFHKVSGTHATFLSNQFSFAPDKGIVVRSLRSHNNGGRWEAITAPPLDKSDQNYEECLYGGCFLQLHDRLTDSLTHSSVSPIFSLKTAVGLIISHGTVGKFLNLRNMNLYISRDGGSHWFRALSGVHTYAVGGHGGVIVSCLQGSTTNSVLYSLDEGFSWDSLNISQDNLTVSKILTAPDSSSLIFNVWGHNESSFWTVISLDFSKEKDFMKWPVESSFDSYEPCVLGQRMYYYRKKLTSNCLLEHTYTVKNETSPCACTKEDFECDVGYRRPNINEPCVPIEGYNYTSPSIACEQGQSGFILSSGYRKMAGDICTGGVENLFPYNLSTFIPCTTSPAAASSSSFFVLLTLLYIVFLIISLVVAHFLYRKKNYWRSRYAVLAQEDHDLDLPSTALEVVGGSTNSESASLSEDEPLKSIE